MRPKKLAPLCGLLLLVLTTGGCRKWVYQLKARDQLNKGVGAFRGAQFQQAIEHFQRAVSLDPSFLNARLYLASAYQQLYIPEGDSAENVKIGQQAIDAFEEVLKIDPNNTTAIATVALIYYQMHKFDKAKEYQRRRMELEPNNPDPHYWIGVIDWVVAYKNDGTMRNDLKLNTPNASGVFPPLPEKARAELEKQNAALVEEGLKSLQKALELKPNDFDTMAYLNLIYRQKADIEKDPEARAADVKTADDWQEKAVGVRKQAAEKTASAAK
jgi:tetratricopeptide (TPR) repeat protein